MQTAGIAAVFLVGLGIGILVGYWFGGYRTEVEEHNSRVIELEEKTPKRYKYKDWEGYSKCG